MRCAILCNGPSRVAYTPSSDYAMVIGCNIPWTDVDATVIVDRNVIDKILAEPHLITCRDLYLGPMARKRLSVLKHSPQRVEAEAIHQRVKEYISVDPNYHSSGHCAAEVALRKKATSLDIYGCDSYFQYTSESYTRNFIKFSVGKENYHRINGWRARWEAMKTSYPDCTFNFIRGTNDNTNSVQGSISTVEESGSMVCSTEGYAPDVRHQQQESGGDVPCSMRS